MTISWISKHHSELDIHELYAILSLCTQVFVVEQNCPYLETDGHDLLGDTCHLLARDGDMLAGYLRLLDPRRMNGEVVIGRVVIAEQARGSGLGHRLMEQGLAGRAGLSAGAGASAKLLRTIWFRGGDRGVPGG